MASFIKIGKPTKRAYGNEYPVAYVRNKKVVHSEVMFGNDLKSVRRAYTTDFENARIKRVKSKSFKRVIGGFY
jgi:hypothetical protein